MNKENLLSYIYEDFHFEDDILINHPQGQYSNAMVVSAFTTLLEAVKEKGFSSWFLLQHYDSNLQLPDMPEEFVLDYYKSLRSLGCQRAIIISDLPILKRVKILNNIKLSGILLNIMPTEESAICWIQYLKRCQEKTQMNSCSYPPD